MRKEYITFEIKSKLYHEEFCLKIWKNFQRKKKWSLNTVESQGVFWQRDAVQGAQSADFGLCD